MRDSNITSYLFLTCILSVWVENSIQIFKKCGISSWQISCDVTKHFNKTFDIAAEQPKKKNKKKNNDSTNFPVKCKFSCK